MTVDRAERSQGVFVLEVAGPLRAPASLDLQRRVEAVLGRGRRCILLDLEGVTDLDAAGLGELVYVYVMVASAKGVLQLSQATGRVRRLIEIAGLYELLCAAARPEYEPCC